MNIIDAGTLCYPYILALISVDCMKDKLKHLTSTLIMALLLKCGGYVKQILQGCPWEHSLCKFYVAE